MPAQRTERALDKGDGANGQCREARPRAQGAVVAERERQGKDAGIAQREKREGRQGSPCCEGCGFARNKDKKSLKGFEWKIMLILSLSCDFCLFPSTII